MVDFEIGIVWDKEVAGLVHLVVVPCPNHVPVREPTVTPDSLLPSVFILFF